MEKFFTQWKTDGRKPEIGELLEFFTKSVSHAFLSPAELKDALERGDEGLRGWYGIQSSEDVLPSALEYRLRPRNLFFDGIPLTGSIDRIDLLPDQTLRLVDYKTGNIKSQKDLLGEGANGDMGYYRQLMFYRLALSLDANWSKYPVDELRVDFVEGKKGEYRNVVLPIDSEKASQFRSEIRDAWDCLSSPEWWIEYFEGEK